MEKIKEKLQVGFKMSGGGGGGGGGAQMPFSGGYFLQLVVDIYIYNYVILFPNLQIFGWF